MLRHIKTCSLTNMFIMLDYSIVVEWTILENQFPANYGSAHSYHNSLKTNMPITKAIKFLSECTSPITWLVQPNVIWVMLGKFSTTGHMIWQMQRTLCQWQNTMYVNYFCSIQGAPKQDWTCSAYRKNQDRPCHQPQQKQQKRSPGRQVSMHLEV